MTLPLAVGLAALLGWNAHLVLGNKTTIEHHEGVTARIRVRGPAPRTAALGNPAAARNVKHMERVLHIVQCQCFWVKGL